MVLVTTDGGSHGKRTVLAPTSVRFHDYGVCYPSTPASPLVLRRD
ncbi:hypothetical protein FRUB_07337 [Fimbriiglobus ruber]|uniref:Uncharacterized protein n=1 Tax=Fimbriiglobus ruber TaxID=1908690 RepID=A0A225DPV6_9BACT|nr:hypothetical protein FRUB_07337 [Fimbriiglobus ruber]